MKNLTLIPSFANPRYWRLIIQEIILAFKLLTDSRVSTAHKAIPILVAVYLLSPLDLVPAIIPVFGQLDDLALLLLGLKFFTRLVPDDIIADYRPEVLESETA